MISLSGFVSIVHVCNDLLVSTRPLWHDNLTVMAWNTPLKHCTYTAAMWLRTASSMSTEYDYDLAAVISRDFAWTRATATM